MRIRPGTSSPGVQIPKKHPPAYTRDLSRLPVLAAVSYGFPELFNKNGAVTPGDIRVLYAVLPTSQQRFQHLKVSYFVAVLRLIRKNTCVFRVVFQ
jgi:hypothetical protein